VARKLSRRGVLVAGASLGELLLLAHVLGRGFAICRVLFWVYVFLYQGSRL
jgi:hypothetical protein